MAEWSEFDIDSQTQLGEQPPESDLWITEDELRSGDLAADYLRSIEGQEQLADYVQRHFDDSFGPFSPDLPIPVITRNHTLEGCAHSNGVAFTRQEIDMGNNVRISGVFPNFESRFDVDLGDEARSMSAYEQSLAVREAFQDRMYDDPRYLEGLTLEDMDHLVHNCAPRGCTVHHGPSPGHLQLVDRNIHAQAGHTGGYGFWTPHVRRGKD